MNIPDSNGQLVALVGTPPNVDATIAAIVAALIGAGILEPTLMGIQVDGSAGGDQTMVAPSGQAYCWVTLDDGANTAEQTTVQTVLLNFAPTPAKGPSGTSSARSNRPTTSRSSKSSRSSSKKTSSARSNRPTTSRSSKSSRSSSKKKGPRGNTR